MGRAAADARGAVGDGGRCERQRLGDGVDGDARGPEVVEAGEVAVPEEHRNVGRAPSTCGAIGRADSTRICLPAARSSGHFVHKTRRGADSVPGE